MNIAIIGAGPAGIISARNAIKAGHSVVLFEKNARIGGIWDPWSGGAYRNACMQNSRYAFHYMDFPPGNTDEFPGVAQVFGYLSAVAGEDALRESTRLNTEVIALRKTAEHWIIRSISAGDDREEIFDRVIIATGELWQPRRPILPGTENFSGTLITSREYQEPETFEGKNILVIGGGVSGADIASDLVPFAKTVSLSVKNMGLYLPRQFLTGPNDMMHSYLGRCLLSRMSYADFIGYLDTLMPEYMQTYRASGLLPFIANNNAIHVNEKIIPNVAAGLIKVKPQVERFTREGNVEFIDASQEKYDVIITCTGYEMPDYSFIPGFDRTQLYEHFFWVDDPSLAVINPPVDTAGFGAAFPYFDVISQWVINVFSGKSSLPGKDAMRKWCAEHMASLHVKRFYDSWLETIRIGLQAGILPDPAQDFSRYWNIISSVVKPAYLANPPAVPEPGIMDSRFDFRIARIQILSGLEKEALCNLLKKGDITDAEYRAALETDPRQTISVHLPYSQVYL
ncbi:SidA/IucD/PvdA family monooxygenase [Plesiomonas shigelloides]|uniref:flavin-containing monooxygenase n=1 Tax=Plesiomonas shigelloides TaxID=703 RepID=UPI0012623837|nr:FAD-dependent oxidoreductase [Plesiomonas shigelloides]KAB7703048.1 SidA/IucD/PvdA family monooxygenase [Plesiomonas shigelloides]